MHVDAWCTKTADVLSDDSFALRSYLETANMKMRELQTGLNGDAARAEADVPQHMTARQVESLQRQQSDGHLRNHLLATVEECEGGVGNAEKSRCIISRCEVRGARCEIILHATYISL